MNVLDKLLDTVTENAFDNVLENVFENVLYNVFVFVVLCFVCLLCTTLVYRSESRVIELCRFENVSTPSPPSPSLPSLLSLSLSLSFYLSLSLSLSTSLSLSLSLSPSLYLYRFLCRARPLFELRRVIKMFRTARSKRILHILCFEPRVRHILHILDVSNARFDTFLLRGGKNEV